MEPEDPEVASPIMPYPDGTEKTTEPERRRGVQKRLIFVLVVALILGAAVAAAVVFVREFGNESDPNVLSPNEGAPPTVPDFPVQAPATSEGALPVPAPTAVPSSPVSLPAPDPVPTVAEPEIQTNAPVTTPPLVATNAPTGAPVAAPIATASESAELLRSALAPLVLDSEYLASSNTALEWLVATAEAEGGNAQTLLQDQARLVQRYSLLSVDLVSQGSLGATASGATSRVENLPRVARGLDECVWVGVTCTDGIVTQIIWPEQFLRGSISENIGLLAGLVHLDLGENELQGTIPQSIYNLANLQYLYLHSNVLSGSISESISNLSNLRNLYLSNNQLTGSLPSGIGSPASGQASVRPLRYLTVYNNKMSGTLPSGLNLRNLFYLDLGRNNFEGTIPVDWYEGRDTMNNLRHLLADHNSLSGVLSSSFPTIGSGRLDQVTLNDNQFSGDFPGGWDPVNALEVIHIENNQFSSLSRDFCIMSVFVGGEVTDLRSDCSICPCNDIWCRSPHCT